MGFLTLPHLTSPLVAAPETTVHVFGRLLEVAEESYRDPPSSNGPNNNNNALAADFGRMGLEVVSHISDPASDTHCFVLKDQPRAVRACVRACVSACLVLCFVFCVLVGRVLVRLELVGLRRIESNLGGVVFRVSCLLYLFDSGVVRQNGCRFV